MMDSTALLVRKDRRASLCSASRRDPVTLETVAPDGDVIDTWIEGSDVVHTSAKKVFFSSHSLAEVDIVGSTVCR